MAIVRKHIYFSGQVQGVGFRYRAKNAARANDLTGWVDNLWDGRVEMEVQGELSGIERMIQEIEMGSFIRDLRIIRWKTCLWMKGRWSFYSNERNARSNGNFASGIFLCNRTLMEQFPITQKTLREQIAKRILKKQD